jgi:uncharacterized membrane protein YidH (DUF202 family)
MIGVGGSGGAIAAGAVAAQRRKILRKFRDHRALSAESARSTAYLGLRQSLLFRRLVRSGVLVACGGARFYLDEEAAERDQFRRSQLALWILAAVMAAVIAVLILGRM